MDHSLGLGHRRLSIIDLSEGANQPMQAGRGEHVIAYNGEIYNFKELRARLQKKRVKFSTESDTEVLLKSFGEPGDRCCSSVEWNVRVRLLGKKGQDFDSGPRPLWN